MPYLLAGNACKEVLGSKRSVLYLLAGVRHEQAPGISRPKRGMLYLLEPLLAFFAAAALVLLLEAPPEEMPVRLVELHAQDVLSVLQAEGGFEELLDGRGQERVGTLVSALNPAYGWQLEVQGDGAVGRFGGPPKGEVVSASRGVVREGRFFTIRLNIFYN